MRKCLFFGMMGLILSFQTAKADVWTVRQSWSPAKELEYQSWIQKFAQVDMFSNPKRADGSPNPYYGITTDCADTVYSLRIIFSYEQGLPWAMRNPADRTQLITQAMNRFDNVPAEGGRRIHAFINYMTGVVSTHTIANDTYPVSINHIVPGTVIVTSHKNHHSWTIAEVMPNGNPRLIFNSTVGKQSGSRVQQRISWPNPFWVFEPEEKPIDRRNPDLGVTRVPVYVPGSYAGLRYWIPVDQLLNDVKTVPGYSEDQYSLNLNEWKEILTKKLAKSVESVQDIVSRLLTDACADIHQRVDAVVEAETYKSQLRQALVNANTKDLQDILREYNSAVNKPSDNRCLIYDRYDQFSTPSRDQRLFDAVMLARTYFKYGMKTQSEASFAADKLAQFKKIFTDPLNSAKEESASENQVSAVNSASLCTIRVGGETLDLAEVKRRLFRSYLSPNPNEDVAGRWGARGDVPSDLARICTTYGDAYIPYDIDQSEKEAQDEVDVYSRH